MYIKSTNKGHLQFPSQEPQRNQIEIRVCFDIRPEQRKGIKGAEKRLRVLKEDSPMSQYLDKNGFKRLKVSEDALPEVTFVKKAGNKTVEMKYINSRDYHAQLIMNIRGTDSLEGLLDIDAMHNFILGKKDSLDNSQNNFTYAIPR